MNMQKMFFVMTLYLPFTVSALTLPPLPTEPIYYEPPVVIATPEQQSYSCAQLDMAINQLHPYRYSYKPDFYQDKMNKVASTVFITDTIPFNGILAGLYLGYSAVIDEKETRRMLTVEQQIASLQQVKANQHCYE